MEIEARPSLAQAEREAVIDALVREGIGFDVRPRTHESAWSRTGALEAVDDTDEDGCYARSPRSTRGATRA